MSEFKIVDSNYFTFSSLLISFSFTFTFGDLGLM